MLGNDYISVERGQVRNQEKDLMLGSAGIGGHAIQDIVGDLRFLSLSPSPNRLGVLGNDVLRLRHYDIQQQQ